MTTPHDARPHSWLLRIGDSNVWTYCGGDESDADFYGQRSEMPYEKLALYTAADYDALRNELDRRTSDVIVHNGQMLACSEPVMDAYESLRSEVERLRHVEAKLRHEQECHKQTLRLREAAEARVAAYEIELNFNRERVSAGMSEEYANGYFDALARIRRAGINTQGDEGNG